MDILIAKLNLQYEKRENEKKTQQKNIRTMQSNEKQKKLAREIDSSVTFNDKLSNTFNYI